MSLAIHHRTPRSFPQALSNLHLQTAPPLTPVVSAHTSTSRICSFHCHLKSRSFCTYSPAPDNSFRFCTCKNRGEGGMPLSCRFYAFLIPSPSFAACTFSFGSSPSRLPSLTPVTLRHIRPRRTPSPHPQEYPDISHSRTQRGAAIQSRPAQRIEIERERIP